MAWGISPRKTAVIPLNNYNTDHYLTLLYHAFNSLGWHISYFDRDGIIGYTNISWQSYSEEISVRIIDDHAHVKSECVGYQMLFTDYEKNEKNLELLYNEITYIEFHLQHTLQTDTDELIASIPENQFVSFSNPPLGYKGKLKRFLSVFTPKPGYSVTPILVLANIAVFIISYVMMLARVVAMLSVARERSETAPPINMEDIYLSFGFSNRAQVLNGDIWRLITSTFLHFSLLHIAGNMIALIYIGSLIESKLGRWNFLLLYLLTGLCASITSVVWHTSKIMAGASGAIFGLFGVLLALLSTNFYERNARRALLISTAIFVAFCIIPIGKHVDHAAHLGGVVSGYILGLLAYYGLQTQQRNFVAVAASAVAIVYTAACLMLAPAYQIKEYKEINRQTEKISSALIKDFYQTDSLNRDERLLLLKNSALLKMDTLHTLARKLSGLTLPKKQKEIAAIRSKIAMMECEVYKLVYQEFLEDDKLKYRTRIYNTTQKINDLRYKWGQIDDYTEDE
ncbi:rhomboid family intramembrane serine protease [Mucilaginibacter pallidiroseus]|uniref:Rhomboid family intramembrane serine protease n=1 Tax=Mucilaginibacter pallidiroseus TaxID=2599295 RepID=A0A563U4X8_9SPHI|nr:rhomboid family intramembrane serine protease [Mucilaginibacter pallidiroseus]TWR26410.1 rhomboid family intramembrane serine protease [Mucilaginibacter pallidiroseus]